MGIEQEIEAVRLGIKQGHYSNEASVSQGIVLRLLASLDWECFNTNLVWPEYTQSNGKRVDFALCYPPSKPIIFIEVKRIGKNDGAETQLFEYAFHTGVPMAILTDGKEWEFFLPGEQGSYGERRVYKLDIGERDIKECSERFERYLQYSKVVSGEAIDSARDDYHNAKKNRQMQATIPDAWHNMIADADEKLLEIIADRVESLCGFRPHPDVVANFLKECAAGSTAVPSLSAMATPLKAAQSPSATSAYIPTAKPGQIGFSFDGRFYPAPNAIETLREVYNLFIARDPTFGDRFAGLPRHGRTRRYLSRERKNLYPNRPDLVREYSTKLDSGWWMGTNYSKQSISKIISMACEVAGVLYGRDLVENLGD